MIPERIPDQGPIADGASAPSRLLDYDPDGASEYFALSTKLDYVDTLKLPGLFCRVTGDFLWALQRPTGNYPDVSDRIRYFRLHPLRGSRHNYGKAGNFTSMVEVVTEWHFAISISQKCDITGARILCNITGGAFPILRSRLCVI